MHRPLEIAPRVLAENRRRYELLLDMARHYAARDDVERVLAAAMLAANYAWLAPVGLLSDTRLERIVVHAVRGPARVSVDGDRHEGRVLHVLSEAYSIGGHTRLAWRWMSRDQRTSHVVLTNQDGPVPDELVATAHASGGDLHDLRSTAGGLLARAQALREHMDQADLVVMHVHGYDVVALAAANLPGTRPPVVYENHADQSFWLGIAGADLLCDLRPQARGLDVALRCVPDERICVLPMPVDELPAPAGGDLRRQLGIRPDAVVALTVSADWKMSAAWGRGMHHAVERVLNWSPQVSVVLVGATPNRDWDSLAKRYPRRVFPVGRVPDPAPYFALADVYIESYPCRATTSALEAAVLGLPVVALADIPEDDLAYIFQAGSPGLAGQPVASNADRFGVAVRRLAGDPDLRRSQGQTVRAAVLAVHDGAGWRNRLEALYERARSLPAVDVDDLPPESPTDARYGALLLSVNSVPQSPDPNHLLAPLGHLADGLRADLFVALNRDGGRPLTVRAAVGWEHQPDWTTRMLQLAGEHPRLAVSLPFAADDNAQGARTAGLVAGLLASIGQTPETCGDISIDSSFPLAEPRVAGELPFAEEALDWLADLLSSPCWEPWRSTPVGGRVPRPRSALQELAAPEAREMSSVRSRDRD